MLLNDSLYDFNSTIELNNSRNSTNSHWKEESAYNYGVIIICYTLIVVVSLCGNLLVCKVAFGTKKLRTTTNLLIASLACSDLIMTTFNIPFNVARLLLLNWPFGSFLCIFVPLIQTACVYNSTFTMTVIAAHRLWTIRQTRTTRSFSAVKLCAIVFTIWLLAISLSLPHSVFNRVKEVVIYERSLIRCRVEFPKLNINFPLFLTVEAFTTQYLIPLSITCFLYIKIGFIVAKQGKLAGISNDDRRKRNEEAKRKRIIMLVLVVATFATCWFPLNLYHLLVDFKVTHHNSMIFLICHWFAMSSVCYNPLIYCWLNESFRNGAKQLFNTVAGICFCSSLKNQVRTDAAQTSLNTDTTTTATLNMENLNG